MNNKMDEKNTNVKFEEKISFGEDLDFFKFIKSLEDNNVNIDEYLDLICNSDIMD